MLKRLSTYIILHGFRVRISNLYWSIDKSAQFSRKTKTFASETSGKKVYFNMTLWIYRYRIFLWILSRYEFVLKCKLSRAASSLSSSSNWTVSAEMDRTGDITKEGQNFTFPTSLDIFIDPARTPASKQNSSFSVKQVTSMYHLPK